MDFYTDFWERLVNLWNTPIDITIPDFTITLTNRDMSIIIATLSFIACINLAYLLFKPRRGRAKMTKEERKLYERRIISDAITDAIEDKVYRDEISRGTATHWYFLIGQRCGLTDLFPKPPVKPQPPSVHKLKMDIRERLVNIWKTKKALPVAVEKRTPEKVLKFLRRPAKTA